MADQTCLACGRPAHMGVVPKSCREIIRLLEENAELKGKINRNKENFDAIQTLARELKRENEELKRENDEHRRLQRGGPPKKPWDIALPGFARR